MPGVYQYLGLAALLDDKQFSPGSSNLQVCRGGMCLEGEVCLILIEPFCWSHHVLVPTS